MLPPDDMLQFAIVLLALVLALAGAARRLPVPYPVVLVLGGLVLALVPGVPHISVNPDIIFTIFLPPILWAAAYHSDLRQLRRSALPIAGLAVGLVLVTTLVVALASRWAIPGITWASAFILGAVVSSTDSVAATAVANRLGIPRRLTALLEGESLVNDASALVLYHAAVTARVDGTFSLPQALVQFVYDAGVGIAAGVLVGLVVPLASRLIRDTAGSVTLTVMAAYLSWIVGDRLDASAVLACVACGLTMRREHLLRASPAVRVQTSEVWKLLVFLLNGIIFVVLGLEWPNLKSDLPDGGIHGLLPAIVAVCLTVIVARLLWMPLMGRAIRAWTPEPRRGPPPDPKWVLLSGWTGMRGIVTLAAALAVPAVSSAGEPLPYRGRIIVIAFCVVLATLVLQGLTLAPLIRWLGLRDDGEETRELALARKTALDASVERLDELKSAGAWDPGFTDMLRAYYAGTASQLRDAEAMDVPTLRARRATFLAERTTLTNIQRDAVLGLWRQGRITDQSLALALRQIDMQQLMFTPDDD
jgi:CPA1 family monovalent cation:H+ antiporter